MKTEYEGRILEIDIDSVVKKLQELGAKKVANRTMKRYIFNIGDNEWLRLRDDSVNVTLTHKKIISDTIDGTKENEVIVSNMNEMLKIFENLGYKWQNYQENKRVSYILDGVEIEIDTWPKIPTYLEIEGKNEEDIFSTAKKIGYKKEDLVFIGVRKIFDKYGIDINSIKELKF